MICKRELCWMAFIAGIAGISLGVTAAAAGLKQEYKSGVVWPEPKVITPGKTDYEPPSDAIVLFDGKDLSKWNGGDKWKIEDGVAIDQKGDITTKDSFGDCQLHIEFATPEKVSGSSQGRGNSGVFMMNKYEVQILDSYENKTYFDGQCGSIYKQTPPMVNVCRKPGEWQTYGDRPKGRAIPVLVFYFVAGIVFMQRRSPIALRALALAIATTLAVPAWWLTPQNHVTLRQAGKWRDELKAEFSLPPTWDQAFQAEDLSDKYARLRSASRSMALALPMDDEGWADRIGAAITERFRTMPPEDIERAIETQKADYALFSAFSGATLNASNVWVQRALALRIEELTRIPEADWAGFDRSATDRLRLTQAFLRYRDLDQIIAAEDEWGFKSTAKVLEEARANKDPKAIRETCRETEKQLLALNSVEKSRQSFEHFSTLLSESEKQSREREIAAKSRNRFRDARELLFLTAIGSAQEEIQGYFEAKQPHVAYGIARKLAVDWFATAGMLGPDRLKRLETLREKCRIEMEAAEAAGDVPELAPTPRWREVAPMPRLKS